MTSLGAWRRAGRNRRADAVAARLFETGDVVPVHEHGARVGPQDPGDDVEERRLPGSAVPLEGALLAAGLQRGTQFLNANFLLNGKAWLRRVIQPQKFIEAL